jgi:hypothetical protein
MPARRRAVVSTALLAFVGIHAYENLVASEHWPFCSYPMYSWVENRGSGVTSFRVSGLLPNGEELRLQSAAYLFPFDQARFADSFREIQGTPDHTARSQAALASFLAVYEQRRREGKHDGPELHHMRVYRTKHTLDPLARNLLVPEERELIAEVRTETGL